MSEMDASHTSQTSLTVYEAVKYTSSVRMDCAGHFDARIFVHENRSHFELKLHESTMLALRDVLNRWYTDKIDHRGRTQPQPTEEG